ncbi:MAG: hypothetical protein AAGE43_17775 [Pseudomonadota bacterium]
MSRILKWGALGLLGCLVVFVAYVALTRDARNAGVVDEILANPNGERAARTMLLTLADGRSYPVNYLEEDGLVFMGIDGRWWRAFVGEGQPVEMIIRGEQSTGHAIAVLDDPAYTADIFSRLRPTAPEWLPDWLNGKLVVITPDGA